MNIIISTIFVAAFVVNAQINAKIETMSILTGYHFHTYFFQTNEENINEAVAF